MVRSNPCSICSSKWHTQTFCSQKKKKRPAQRGKQTIKYEEWRDEVAKPYLDKEFGRICCISGCSVTEPLDVDHKQNRGSHYDLKFALSNVQYMCRPHHRSKTDNINKEEG